MSGYLKRPALRWLGKRDPIDFKPMQVVEFNCCHCGQRTRFSGPSMIDAAESYWQKRFERLQASLNEVVKRCHMMHGTDPMREDFKRWLIELRERMAREDGTEDQP